MDTRHRLPGSGSAVGVSRASTALLGGDPFPGPRAQVMIYRESV